MHRRLVLEEPISRAAVWSRRLALFSLAVLVLTVLVFRMGEPSIEGLAPVLGAYALVGLSFGLSIIAFVRIWRSGHRGVGIAFQSFALCLLLLLPAGYAGLRLATLPALKDISTDTEDPPGFSRSRAALDGRGGHVPAELPAARRRAQRQAYPQIVPIVLEVPAELAFDMARKAATTMGWRVLEAVRPGGRVGAGRIEAVARTRVLRFADDITIRIRPRVDGSRIDIRSVSRLGEHDFGASAARIAAFAAEIELLNDAR